MSTCTLKSLSSLSSSFYRPKTTKSREAYEAQQLAFLHRPFSGSSAPRRPRPQSAGASGWGRSRDRGGSNNSQAKENGYPRQPPYPPPEYHRPSIPGVSDGGERGRESSSDAGPPPCGRESDNASARHGAGTRLGKPRTRVRPSSANARVNGRPGAGQGVGGVTGGGGGGYPVGSGVGGVPRRVHVPRYAAGYGMSSASGEGGKVSNGKVDAVRSVSRPGHG